MVRVARVGYLDGSLGVLVEHLSLLYEDGVVSGHEVCTRHSLLAGEASQQHRDVNIDKGLLSASGGQDAYGYRR